MSLYLISSSYSCIVCTLAKSITILPRVTIKPKNSTNLVKKAYLLALQNNPYCTS
jgi:hypothetical protein